jgi:hypothetical protein
MRLTRDSAGGWWCSQIKSQQLYTYGNFTFFVNASIDKLDPNVELRMFTMGSDGNTNGISIDVGRRGQTNSTAHDLWYAVYPNSVKDYTSNTSTQIPKLDGTYTTHRFNWLTDVVTMDAEYDHNYQPDIYRTFNSYATDPDWATCVPNVSAPVIISLCTYDGSAPLNGEEVVVNMQLFFWDQNSN